MERFDSPVRGNILQMRSLRDEHNGSKACNDADPRPTLRNRVHRIYLTAPLDAQTGTEVQTGLLSSELVASFRSRGSYAHSARGTPAPTYHRGTSEKCVAPVCGSGDGHRRGCSMLCLYAPGAMTSCAAYEVQLLNPCSLTITRGWRDFQNSQPVL